VEISTDDFENNFRILAAALGGPAGAVVCPDDAVELLAIVKADAYGHGLGHCAPAAVRAGARWLGVTSVEEGVAARRFCDAAGHPETEILAIAGVFPGQGAAVASARLTTVVWEHWQLDELESAALAAGCGTGSVPVHLELDTGMSRQGVGAAELDGILQRIAESPVLRLDGLMTHLYAADESDGESTRLQFAALEGMVERVFAKVPDGKRGPTWLHVGNSAAVLAGEVPVALRKLCERFGLRPMVRPGLALYGLTPEFEPKEPAAVAAMRQRLNPVMAWKTRVVSVRPIEAGQVVGYNGTFVASESMQVALLAVGYADGLKRALSNRGWVLLRGERAPIVGRISMDQTVVDVTGIAGVAAGDEVVLLGSQGAEAVTAEDHARWAGTIPWEIFTSITERVERREIGIRK